jgi:hypothetical protein
MKQTLCSRAHISLATIALFTAATRLGAQIIFVDDSDAATGISNSTTCKLRLYVSHWTNRTVNLLFDNTTSATTLGGIDCGAVQNIPSSLDYTDTLAPGDTDLAATITPHTDGTFHWIGFSNELVGVPVNTFSNWIANPTYGIAAADRGLLADPDNGTLPKLRRPMPCCGSPPIALRLCVDHLHPGQDHGQRFQRSARHVG